MTLEVIKGILIPFLGTSLGSACVFFMRGKMNKKLNRALAGFAGGVMIAASVWSLIIPAIRQSSDMGRFAFFPAAAGLWIGVIFMLALSRIIPRIETERCHGNEVVGCFKKTSMLVLAVVLHNIPEGMAVGVAFAGLISGDAGVSYAGAMALAVGIAIQNFPEGAIISMPLASRGEKTLKAFMGGVLSGIVEPIGAVITLLAAGVVVPALPYILSFAAGAMIYAVLEELIPEMSEGSRFNIGTMMFLLGFTVMMILDVALG